MGPCFADEVDLVELAKKEKIKNQSLFMFLEESSFRKLLVKISTSPIFDNLIYGLIMLSGLALALENPLYDPKGSLFVGLFVFDTFTTITFGLEAIIKIIA